MKFLLGATAALLLGAVFVSWQGMQQGVKEASPEELAQFKDQIAEIVRDELRKNMQQSNGYQGQSSVTPPVGGQSLSQAQAGLTAQQQLIEAQRRLAELEANQANAASQAELDAQLQRDEEGLLAQRALESTDIELRRSRLISQALLVGRVTDYVDDPQFGGFITLEILMPEQVQVGSVLGIRRNKTGILYQFKVSDISPDGAIANPTTAIGSIKPQKGDELIFPPLY